MKLRKLAELKVGDLLAKSVFDSDYSILLADSTVLTTDYIEKLKQLGITEVYIHDENYRNDEEMTIMKEEIVEFFHEKVKSVMEKHIYIRNQELQRLNETANEIVTKILEEKDVMNRVYDIRERSTDLYEHSISTCVLATLVSLKLRMDKNTVHDISVACLLHDVGLRYLSFEIEDKTINDFNLYENHEYHKHTIYGYTSLENENWISETSKRIILYHHEYNDGSGFPMKIRDIPLETQIVTVCDTFDEMICGILQTRQKVHEAIESLRSHRGDMYNELVVNLLLEFLAVYPVGTNVVTSDGEAGVVVCQNHGYPDRPVIKIVADKDGNPLSEQTVRDLKDETDVKIDKVL
jgi:HD-GYP domain-containing protein (c-di-GMP phosphodiesterase class II)